MTPSVTVKDLMEILLTMPQDAVLCTYHMGDYPYVAIIDCTRMGGSSTIVELNLVTYED